MPEFARGGCGCRADQLLVPEETARRGDPLRRAESEHPGVPRAREAPAGTHRFLPGRDDAREPILKVADVGLIAAQ